MQESLREHGFYITPQILPDRACDDMMDGIWSAIEHLTGVWDNPVRRDQPDSWRGFYELYPLKHCLIQQHGIGHAPVSWKIRQDPRVLALFAELWSMPPEDLLVSFDGLSLGLPPEKTRKGWHQGTDEPHVDQAPDNTEFKGYQSWITARDVDSADFTIMVLPGSHRVFEELVQGFGLTGKADWFKMAPEHMAFYESRGCIPMRLSVPKGCMVIWDSRLVHCGTKPLKGRPSPNIRGIVYLCYVPRCQASEKELARKRKAFTDRRTTSHDPVRFRLFPNIPRTYGGDLKPVSSDKFKPVVEEIGMRLAGF
ncbi:unnamed protein product [Ectocarpus fasciculatus]